MLAFDEVQVLDPIHYHGSSNTHMMDVAADIMVLYLLLFFFGDDGLRVFEFPFVWQHLQQLTSEALAL